MQNNAVDELLSQYGIESSDIPEVVAETAKGYYEHKPGVYLGLIGKLKPVYKDFEGKKCEAKTPGAMLKYFMLQIIIKRNETTQQDYVINGQIADGEDYGKFMFQQYLSVDPKDQWKYKKLLANLVSDDNNIKIVVGDDKQYTISYKNFPLFYGMSVNLTLEAGKKGGVFAQSIVPVKATITKDLFEKRSVIMAGLYARLEAILEQQKAANKPNVSVDMGSAEDPDAILNAGLDADSFV